MVTSPAAGGFGVGNMGAVPVEVLQALYPYLTFGPDMAMQMALAQYQGGISMAGIQADAASRAQAAQAQVAAANVAAQGGITQQNIQSGTQASIANAQNAADIIRAAGGDRNAANRLASQNQMTAGLANQQIQAQIMEALTSTGLRDQLQARNFARGFASQPEFAGATQFLDPSRLYVNAPGVQFADYDWNRMQQAQATQGSMASPSFNIGGGGGGTSVPNMDLSGIFGNYQSQLQNLFGNFQLQNAPTTAPTPTPTPIPTPTPSVANTQGAFEKLLAMPGSGQTNVNPALSTQAAFAALLAQPGSGQTNVPGFASGGRIKGMGIVGEEGEPELVVAPQGAEVIPLSKIKGYADGGTIPSYGGRVFTDDSARRWIAGAQRDAPDILPKDIGTMAPGFTTPTPPPAVSGVPPVEEPSASGPTPGTTTVTTSDGTSVTTSTPQGPTQTGQEIMNLPGYRALVGGQQVGGYPGSGQVELPEYGLTGNNALPAPAHAAYLLSAASPLNQLEKADLAQLYQTAGIPAEVLVDILNKFTPAGFRAQGFGTIGF